jgi:hypothetical protein
MRGLAQNEARQRKETDAALLRPPVVTARIGDGPGLRRVGRMI